MNTDYISHLSEYIDRLVYLHKCRETIDREITATCKQALDVHREHGYEPPAETYPPLRLVKS